MLTNRPAVALAAMLALFAAPARADVVRDPPPDCPPGSSADTAHCGPLCRALTCTSDADCKEGNTCQSTKACLHTYECFDPAPQVHGGPCTNDGCALAEDTCQTTKLCLPADDPSTGDSGSSGNPTGVTTDAPATSTTEATPTTGTPTTSNSGEPTGGNTVGSTGAATSSTPDTTSTTSGTGDKGGCANCSLTDGPPAALALLLLLARPRRRT